MIMVVLMDVPLNKILQCHNIMKSLFIYCMMIAIRIKGWKRALACLFLFSFHDHAPILLVCSMAKLWALALIILLLAFFWVLFCSFRAVLWIPGARNIEKCFSWQAVENWHDGWCCAETHNKTKKTHLKAYTQMFLTFI